MLHGARQSGKSTIARQLARERKAVYANLDIPAQLEAALAEPLQFVSASPQGLMVIDEVQRGGQNLLLAIKNRLDLSNRPGQFLLTGSANYLTLPTVSETLQGRIAVDALHPFAQSELARPRSGFSAVDAAFSKSGLIAAHRDISFGPHDYWERVTTGGYPEIQSRGYSFQSGWFHQYVETAVSREIIDLGNISDRAAVIRVIDVCAARSAQVLNVNAIARATELARRTVVNYLSWLEAAHLITVVPAWRRSLAQRHTKSAKLLVSDSGLACHRVGRDAFGLAQRSDVYRGQALETFVGAELNRHLGWSFTRARLHHWRTVQGNEVDFVLESPDGRVVGIEVKATTSPGRNAGRGLANLRDAIDRAGGAFAGGYVLHMGPRSLPLGDRITAAPIAALWQGQDPDAAGQ